MRGPMMGEVLGWTCGIIGDGREQYLGSSIPESAAGSAAENPICGSHIAEREQRLGQNLLHSSGQGVGTRMYVFLPTIPPSTNAIMTHRALGGL